jgi:hypothetical protein
VDGPALHFEGELERTLGTVGSVGWVEAAADAFVTSRRWEPPCWLVIRRIFADE